jgi:hypothetical protein
VEDGLGRRVAFAQRLGPVAGLVGQVRAGVLGQASFAVGRVVVGETEAQDAVPALLELDKLDENLKKSK